MFVVNSNPICSLQLNVECYEGFVNCIGAHLKFEKLKNRTASQNVQQAAVSSVRSYFHPAFAWQIPLPRGCRWQPQNRPMKKGDSYSWNSSSRLVPCKKIVTHLKTLKKNIFWRQWLVNKLKIFRISNINRAFTNAVQEKALKISVQGMWLKNIRKIFKKW